MLNAYVGCLLAFITLVVLGIILDATYDALKNNDVK